MQFLGEIETKDVLRVIWKEFRGAPKAANLLNFAMFVIFLVGLALIIRAGA